jgi:long-chain acyl-CoA synthetase
MNMKNLVQMLRASAARFPVKFALIFCDKKITYKELDQMSDRLAQGLLNLGVKKNDRIAMLLQNCPEFVIGYFAIIKTSAICVPINNMLKEHEIDFILSDSESNIIITSIMHLDKINAIKNKVYGLKQIILIDGLTADTLNLYDIIERSGSGTGRREATLDEDDTASILYTSGTTGDPKGAMLTHKNFLSNVGSCVLAINADEKDNFICLLPMFHSFAFTVCILIPLSVGAGIIIIEHLMPFRRVIRNVIKKKVTIFVGIPSIFNILAHMHIPAIFTSRVLRLIDPLRLCISGAAALPVEVLRAFEEKFKMPLLEGYGLTEASPVVSLNPMHGRRKPGSVGFPLKDVEVKIVGDKDNGLPLDQIGELLVKGQNVMKGYYRNEQATKETIKDGWLYTGDIAKIDREGYVYIVDRKKDMINVRGLNVYPAEIEKFLLNHPKIKEVAVVGVPDKFKGEVPKAFIVLKSNEIFSSEELIKYLRDNLAVFKIPKYVEFRTDLPKTATGKILKRQLVF